MELVLATHNTHKRDEFQQLFAGRATLLCASDFHLPIPEETGLTFIENALIKARCTAKLTGKTALSDDSGLVVPALNGEPGIHSARYAGTTATSEDNIQKLLNALSSFPESCRNAFFYCVLVLVKHEHDPMPIIAEGVWHGTIAQHCRGQQGFGYDPVFFLPDRNQTVAELPAHVKNALSHRHRAFTQLMQKWSEHT